MPSRDISRRCDQEEVNVLIDLINANHAFLTEALTNAKTKQMVDARWDDISRSINSLGCGSPFAREKVKKKWFDLKSKAKRDVALFKTETRKTGGGDNNAPKPSDM